MFYQGGLLAISNRYEVTVGNCQVPMKKMVLELSKLTETVIDRFSVCSSHSIRISSAIWYSSLDYSTKRFPAVSQVL